MAATHTPTLRRRPLHRRWEFAVPIAADAALVRSLSSTFRLSDVCARILVARGFSSADAVEKYLSRRMDQMHDPAGLPDMDKAVARIAEAVAKDETIVLFGDYDVDGVTATALLARFLRVLKAHTRSGFAVEALVPEREHGYGLGAHAVGAILARKPRLVITLDNGISAHAAIDALAQAGADCIVVDHHHAAGDPPRAVAVVNPKRTDIAVQYPFTELCGAGLSFKLAWALAVHFSQNRRVSEDFRSFLLDALALAAAGTLADVVPLQGENRVLAWHGLKALAHTRLPRLRALMENSRIAGEPRASDVSFRIAPRINAAGRCGRAAAALELLLTEDDGRARALAAVLEGCNTDRQGIEGRILEDARAQALAALQVDAACKALVLDSCEWHVGVIGIVASRLVEEFHRPTFLLCVNKESGRAQGSGRSIRKLHLYDALEAGKEHLITFGGHAAAAGLTMDNGKIVEFRAAFTQTVANVLTSDDLTPSLRIDERIGIAQIDPKLCLELDQFEPCGAGNPRPMLAALNVTLPAAPKLLGKDERHLSFFARQGGAVRRVVGFNCAEHFNTLCELGGQTLDLAFRPQINTFRGDTSVELVMEAFKKSEDA